MQQQKKDPHGVNRGPASYRYGEKLPPESAMLEELLKTTEIQQLFEAYYSLIDIPVAIIDFKANVLFSSRWQRICTQFHRVDPTTCGRCIESDTLLATRLQEGKLYTIYACQNGMTDCAAPIIMEGKHVANVFIGQFLTQAPDESWFRRHAEEFGFDVADYLDALREVPVVNAERIPAILDMLIRMTRLITNLAIDRKRAVESQARQAILLNTIPQAVFWKDLQGRYIGCNSAFARAAGLASPDDIAGKTDFDLPWPREEAEAYRADDLAVISANRPKLHIEEPLQQADGTRILIDTSKIPVVGAGGIPTGVIGVYEDISERKRAEEALRDNELKYRALFETAEGAILLFADGRWVDCNAKALTVFGCSREAILGSHPSKFSPPTQPDGRPSEPEAMRLITLAYTTGPQSFEWVHCRADGTTFAAEVNLNRLELGGKPHIQAIVRDISERKRADEALMKSEERFHLSMEATNDGLWDWNKETDEVYYSPACYHMLGYEVGAFPGTLKGWQDLLHPDDVEQTMRVNMDCVEGRRENFAVEYRLKAKNGEWRWILGRGKSIARDAQGRSLRLVGTNSDITERKQAGESIRESEAKFRAAFMTGADAFYWATLEDGKIVEINESFESVFGYPRDEVIGRTSLELGLYAKPSDRARMLAELREKGVVRDLELAGRKKGGALITVSLSARPVSQSGRMFLLGIIRDITERKKAAEILKESEERYRTLFDGAQDGVALADIETGRLFDCNPALCHMVERDKSELVGQMQSILHSEGDLTRLTSSFRFHLSGDAIQSVEDDLVSRSGQLIPVEIRAAKVRIGSRDLLLGIFRDITERRQSLNKLQSALTGTIKTLATVVESRDPYTAGHQVRVAELAVEIASEMRLEADRIEGIRMAGVIHDVGKVTVPAEILSKPTRLKKAEFELIKDHPQIGYEMVKDIAFPWPIATIILEHHERMDGSGYPKGLAGEDLLLESRILTVADVVEAMASHRPYRPALGIEAALAEIEKNKGTLFDASVVAACLSLFRDKGYRLKEA